jgi:DNA-binding MarR family transcriptional regulator
MVSEHRYREAGDQKLGQPKPLQQRKSINFKIYALASSLFKGATQYYSPRFGIGLPEMRVLSNLDRDGPLAAYQIVALTVMDKGLVSRVLTALRRRRLVTSSAPKSDPRRRAWQLTNSGQDLVDRLRPEWRRREAIIQACLSEAERSVLLDLLDRLFVASERLRAGEAMELQSQQKDAAGMFSAKTRAAQPQTIAE